MSIGIGKRTTDTTATSVVMPMNDMTRGGSYDRRLLTYILARLARPDYGQIGDQGSFPRRGCRRVTTELCLSVHEKGVVE
jgi:hypothetical protein